MRESAQSAEFHSLQTLVADAWSKSNGPPELAPILGKCDSGEGQLAVLLSDLQRRHQHGIARDLNRYLELAELVSGNHQLRVRLLEEEYQFLHSSASPNELNDFLSNHPEVCMTQGQETDERNNDDTLIEADQPSPPVVNIPALRSSVLPSFGRYITEKLLGKGGFGSVYLAHDAKLDRYVAIKSLHPGKFDNEQQRRKFLEELRSTARLNHPCIVTLYDVAEASDGSLFAVMEYVDGEPLADRLRKSSLSVSAGIEVLVQVAQALSYAHRQGFFHRDLKPANILVDQDGRPRVADFGLAVHEDNQRVRVGERAGTPPYMAPEQIRGETHRLDGRTDIWCFGVIMYEMLTGRLPFKGDSVKQLFDEILNRNPRPPRQVDPVILPELDRICCHCLAKDVNHRFGNAEDLATQLDGCIPLLNTAEPVSIASNPALVIAGLGLIGVGSFLCLIGGFFLWVTFMALKWAFAGLGSTQEFLVGMGMFGFFSSPFFFGMPVIILGLWLLIVQGNRSRGRTQYTSGKAVASLALASLTPVFNLLTFVPTLIFARQAFQETKRSPRVKGRLFAVLAVVIASVGMAMSTWISIRTIYVYSAYASLDRARAAMDAEKYDDAVFESRLATTKFPSMAGGWSIRGHALLESQQPMEARDALTTGLSLYRGLLTSEGLERTKHDINMHNIAFSIAECYRMRAMANRAMGEESVASEDQIQADWFRDHTIGRRLRLGEMIPAQGLDIPAARK
ncbi:MAG: serine/threonine-protein kinase [Rubripirellula sp.]